MLSIIKTAGIARFFPLKETDLQPLVKLFVQNTIPSRTLSGQFDPQGISGYNWPFSLK
jgi:hypothetical protein